MFDVFNHSLLAQRLEQSVPLAPHHILVLLHDYLANHLYALLSVDVLGRQIYGSSRGDKVFSDKRGAGVYLHEDIRCIDERTFPTRQLDPSHTEPVGQQKSDTHRQDGDRIQNEALNDAKSVSGLRLKVREG